MPLYEYCCHECGVFEDVAPLAAFDKPKPCPTCEREAPRTILTAPRLSAMSSERRHAHETNERSADSPKPASHGPGCSCCSGSKKAASKTLYRPDGSKSFPSKRPWMISH